MATTLLNQRPEGTIESQGLVEFRRNKPPQFTDREGLIMDQGDRENILSHELF